MWETDRTPQLASPSLQGHLSSFSNFHSRGVTLCVLSSREHSFKTRTGAFLSCVQRASNLQQSLTARAYARLTHFVTHEGLPQISLRVQRSRDGFTQDFGHISRVCRYVESVLVIFFYTSINKNTCTAANRFNYTKQTAAVIHQPI